MSKKFYRIISWIVITLIIVSSIPDLGLGTINSYAVVQKGLAVKYDDFYDTTGLQLTRDASASGGVLTVSPNNGSVVFGVTYTSEKIKLINEDSFSTYFTFTFANGTSPYAGDGMTFSLQPLSNSTLGTSCNRFAIYNIEPSISIEFDTFQNTGYANSSIEPNGNHIAVFKNGDPYGQNIATAVAPSGLNAWNTNTYHVWIDYDGTSDTITVKMNTTDDLMSATTVLTATGLDIYSILGTDEVFAGFTAASGDYREDHNVQKWYMCNDYDPIDTTRAYYETTTLASEVTTVSTTEAAVTCTLTDHLGQPVAGEAVSFEAVEGSLTSANGITDANGQVNVSLQSDIPINAEITAVAESGRFNRTSVSIEGAALLSDQESVDADIAQLNITNLLNGNPDADNVTTDLSLPTEGSNGSTISWSSSNPDIISTTGAVVQAAYTAGDQNVTLTATVSKGTAVSKITAPFEFIVKAKTITDQESVDADIAQLNITNLLNGNPDAANITTDLSLPTEGSNGTTISWSSSNPNVISTTGAVVQEAYTAGDQSVTLTATVSKGTAVSKTTAPFEFTVKAQAANDQECVDADVTQLNITNLLNENPDALNITTNLSLPTAGANGTTISWSCYEKKNVYTYYFGFLKIISGWKYVSSDIISNTGTVTRPERNIGDKTVYLKAFVSKGTATSKTTQMFEFTIKKKDLTVSEKVDLDYNWLRGQVVLNGNINSDVIKTNLSFPAAAPNGTAVTWTTSDSSLIDEDGIVTRPSYKEGSRTVEVTSTNTLDGVSKTKHYVFKVIAKEPSDAQSIEEDTGSLDYASFVAENASPFSIESNLSLPSAGVYGSTILWDSSNPDVISNSGVVNRPSHEEGFQSVVLTATIQKGTASDSKNFMVSVNPLPDTTAPTVESSTPSNGDTMINDCTAVIKFSEDIKIADVGKINVSVIDGDGTQGSKYYYYPRYIFANVNTSVNGSSLTVEPVFEATDINKIQIHVQAGAVNDLSGNVLQNDFTLTYIRKTSRPVLTSSNIQNNQKAVNISRNFEFTFDNLISMDEDFIKLEVIDGWKQSNVAVTITKDNNKFAITPLYELLPNSKYKLTILEEAVKDSAGNPLKEPMDINFSTAPITEINLVSPLDTGDVYQYGNYIKLDFDQYFNVSFSSNTINYYVFGKSLFIDTTGLGTQNIDGKECYDLGRLSIYSKYNSNCAVSFSTSKVIKTYSKRTRIGRGSRSYTGYAIPVINTESIPKTPANFGEEIKTPYDVTLDYGKTIKAIDLSMIRVENEYGKLINTTPEVDGTKLVIRPNSGAWDQNQSYILKIPEGAMQYSEGTKVKEFEYLFKTPVKYDYSSSSIYIGSSKIVVGGINESWLNIRNNRPYIYSYTVPYTVHTRITNLTTGEVKIDKNYNYYSYSDNINDTPGIYEILYTIEDNGYQYEVKDTYEVVEINDAQTEIKSDRTGTVKVIDYTAFEDTYTARAYLANGALSVSNRDVKFELIGKKSGKIYYSKTRKTNQQGYTGFTISVDNLPAGIYKAVFSYMGTNKSYMYYIQIQKKSGKANANILLYDNKTKQLIRSNETIYLSIDGGSPIEATRLKNYTYQIEELRPGEHSVELSGVPYYCDKTFTVDWKSNSNKTPIYLKRYVPSSNISMSSTKSDYGSSYGKDLIFIDGVDANITFETSAYWNNHQPGKIIYEFYNYEKVKKYSTTDGKITVNVGDLLGKGTRGRVYAVSPDGTVSEKQDLNMEVAGKPSYCYVSYSDKKKQYFLNYNFSMETMGSASVPEDWPLIGGDDLEINTGKCQVGGVMDSYGKIEFAVGLSKPDFENAKVKSNYKDLVDDFKAGKFGGSDSDLAFSFDTNQSWQYDTGKKAWKYTHGDYILYLEGEISYTQYFMVFVVPTYLKGSLGVDANAKLNVDVVVENPQKPSDSLKYSGELNVSPSIEISVGAGVSGLSVEGFLNGTIDMSTKIPDFNVNATGTITGGIRATALCWDWEKDAIKYSWGNAVANYHSNYLPLLAYNGDLGALSIKSDLMNTEQSNFSMISRSDTDSSVWVGDQQIPVQSKINYRVFDSILLNKIPDFTHTAITPFGNHLFLVWPEDNPNRTSANRTELKYGIYNGLQWTEGQFFNQDGTADYNPVAETTGDTVTIAWQNQNKLMTDQDQMGDYLAASEISVAKYNTDDNTIGDAVTLTNDAYYDCMPEIAYSKGKTYLAWVKNRSNNVLSSEAGSFDILYSQNSGAGWSKPVVLEYGLNQITDLDITANGDKVTILYGLDDDGNIFSSSDVELYAKEYSGSSWSSSEKLTDDQIQDCNARVMLKNGDTTAIWLRNGVLTEMDLATKVVSSVKNISAQAFEIAHTQNGMEAIAYTSQIENGLQSTATVFYDIDAKQWSEPIIITQNDSVNSNTDAAITSDNRMTVINKAAEKITEKIDGEEYSNVGDANIEMHEMPLVMDLKIAKDSIGFSTPFILNDNNDLQVVVENCGEFTVKNFDVAFYDGNMNKIGVESVNTPLLSGQQITISTTWLAPESLSNGNITVVVDPEDTISDVDRTNNTITEEAITSDVSIEDVETYPIADNNYLLKLTLGNYTAVDAENVRLNFYHNDSLINTQDNITIESGSQEEVLMELDTGTLFGDEDVLDGQVEVSVSGTFSDGNTDNNSVNLTFEKPAIQVVSSNITDGESNISTNSDIELDLSSNITSSDGYDEIALTDFGGNKIPVNKEITESRLKVTPVETLEPGNYYSLSVPQNAIASANAQTLGSDYVLSFTTDNSDLSVTGTYPSYGWTDVDREGNIVLRFNKNILKSVDFNSIQMLKNNTSTIAAAVTIKDTMLIIDPVNSLSYNTTYSVLIPAWAIEDENGNNLGDYYTFSFTTMDGTNDNSKNGNDSSGAQSDVTYQESEDAFIVDLPKDTATFTASEPLIKNIQGKNKPLKIIRQDITINMQSELVMDGLGVVIENRPATGESTDPNDKILSDIYSLSVVGGSVDNFNGQLSVDIQIDRTMVTNPEKCAVFYLDKDGKWQSTGGTINTTFGTMHVNLYSNRPFMVVQRDISFADIKNLWSQNAIEVLSARGIVSGRAENRFDPTANITRAEFTALVVRSLFEGNSDYQNKFNDFNGDSWYADYIEKAVELNLVNGVGAGRFAPNEKISREDMMVILYRLYQLRTEEADTSGSTSMDEILKNNYSDYASVSNYAKEAIDEMIRLGIIKGYDGMIKPKDHATREESAMMIYRLLQKID